MQLTGPGHLDDSDVRRSPPQVCVIPTPELDLPCGPPPTPGWLPIKTWSFPASPLGLEPPEEDRRDHVAAVCPPTGPKLGM